MYIGNDLKTRMNLLDIDISRLSEITFIDKDIINDILEDKLPYEQIDDFDMSMICSALHLDEQYFTNNQARDMDFLSSVSENDSVKSNTVKAKLQDFVNDFAFLNEMSMSRF